MKKLFFTSCLFLSLAAPVALAQTGVDNEAALHERVTALSQRIAQTAKLNEGQYVRVKRLNLVMMTEMNAIKSRLAATPAKMDEQLAELQARYDWELATLLSPNQLTAYNNARISALAVNNR